jgi:hypothetical protein
MQHRRLAASLCLLAAAAAGCGASQAAPAARHLNAILGRPAGTSGGSPPADASLTGVHACKLIDATVIRSVIGPLFRAPYEVPDGLECFYEPAVPGGAGPDVIVTVMPRSGFEAAEAFDQGAAQAGAITFATVPGLGDSGYTTSQSNGAQHYSVSAARGGRAVGISVASTSPAAERQVMELMQAAITHL